MNQLSDGTIIPSHLGIQGRGAGGGSSAILNDYVMRLGEIKKVIYPGSPGNYGGKTVEYEVEVQYREGNSTYSTATYRGCSISTLFGGVADRFHATLRPDTASADSAYGNGSKVLLLCLAGDQQKAIILGGVEDPLSSRTENQGSGHNLFFEFNGIRCTIDNDGQLQVTLGGATAVDGKPRSDVVDAEVGTTVTINKNGNLTVATKDNDQFLRLNHADKKVEIVAGDKWDVQTRGQVFLGSGGQFKVQTDADMSFVAQARVDVQSAGVTVGAGTNAWMLGTVYRNAEALAHSGLSTALKSASGSAATAGSSLLVAAPLNAIPVIGGLLALPGFLAAGAALTAMAPFLAGGAASIDAMEANAALFLSTKNTND